MWFRTLAASSSYLKERPQSAGKAYSVACGGTSISAEATVGKMVVIPTAAPATLADLMKSRRANAGLES